MCTLAFQRKNIYFIVNHWTMTLAHFRWLVDTIYTPGVDALVLIVDIAI